jgi:hypothetical protein
MTLGSNPILIVLNAPIITGAMFVLPFHIMLTSIYSSWNGLVFSVSLVLKLESSGLAISISRQVFYFLSYSGIPGQFATIFRPVITGTCHIIVVPLTFKTLSGTSS